MERTERVKGLRSLVCVADNHVWTMYLHNEVSPWNGVQSQTNQLCLKEVDDLDFTILKATWQE